MTKSGKKGTSGTLNTKTPLSIKKVNFQRGVLMILLIISTSYGVALYLKNRQLKMVFDHYQNVPQITKAPAEVTISKTVTLEGTNLGDQLGFVKLRNGKSIFDVKVISWGDTVVVAEVPFNIPYDQTYYISVNVPEFKKGYYRLATWAISNQITVIPDYRWYTVQEGDSLFGIAGDQLGSQSKYLEIVELNKNLYPNLDLSTVLTIGMKIRLPNE